MNDKYLHLSLEERVKIEVFLDHGASMSGFARCEGSAEADQAGGDGAGLMIQERTFTRPAFERDADVPGRSAAKLWGALRLLP